jgi:hypothetical protein
VDGSCEHGNEPWGPISSRRNSVAEKLMASEGLIYIRHSFYRTKHGGSFCYPVSQSVSIHKRVQTCNTADLYLLAGAFLFNMTRRTYYNRNRSCMGE